MNNHMRQSLKNLKGKNLKVNFSLPFFMRENIMIYVLNCGNCFGRETICRANDISNKKNGSGYNMKELKDYVRSIPDFPEPGIIFRDVTSVLQDAEGFKLAIDSMIKLLDGVEFDVIAGAESRGFILGAPIAYAMGKPFVLIRKKGKLPCETIEQTYDLEYGTATIEMHRDSIKPGQKVVLVDDLIATGGTVEAAIKLIEQLGGEVVKVIFMMELAGLNGRAKLANYDVASVITYEGK